MTRRLTRSIRGFARRVQMGHSESIFVVTEGKNTDRWFYDRLLREDDALAGLGIVTFTVSSISGGVDGGGEGKDAVLRLFRKLRSTGQLRQTNSSGPKSMIFCVDSDHDRLAGGMLRSNHLVYTMLPDVEAHVIDSCELVDVVSHVTSLPFSEAKEVIASLGDWQSDFARGRLDWMVLCCTAHMLGIRNAPRPGTPPTKCDKGPLAAAKQQVVDDLRRMISSKAAAESLDDPRLCEERVRRRFETALEKGQAAMLLKGKWIVKFLKFAIEDEAGKVAGEVFVLTEQAILSAARAGARFNSKWCSETRERVAKTLVA